MTLVKEELPSLFVKVRAGVRRHPVRGIIGVGDALWRRWPVGPWGGGRLG